MMTLPNTDTFLEDCSLTKMCHADSILLVGMFFLDCPSLGNLIKPEGSMKVYSVYGPWYCSVHKLDGSISGWQLWIVQSFCYRYPEVSCSNGNQHFEQVNHRQKGQFWMANIWKNYQQVTSFTSWTAGKLQVACHLRNRNWIVIPVPKSPIPGVFHLQVVYNPINTNQLLSYYVGWCSK